MSAADKFLSTFKDAFKSTKGISESEKDKVLEQLDRAYGSEPPPMIAVVGETGVGKSTTLNALFNAGAAVGHSRPTTNTPDHFQVEAYDHKGNKGTVRVLDLPGLGESIQKAEEILSLYHDSLPSADVILWVHPVNDRMLEFTQRQIGVVFSGENEHLISRLVFGLNKADSIHPGDWRRHANIPSETQFAHLADAAQNFAEVISTVLPHRQLPRTVTYSALARYQLAPLFTLLMEATPPKRRWVLEQRMDLADFKELADPGFIRAATGVAPAPPKVRPDRAAIVSMMTTEDLRKAFTQGWTAEDWWERERA